MSSDSATHARPRLTVSLAVRAVVLLMLWTLYVAAFWGRFSRSWPSWVRDYTGCGFDYAWHAYRWIMPVGRIPPAHRMAVWLVVSFVFGGLVPLAAVRLLGRRWGDVGMGMPNQWGRRVLLVCICVSLPFGYLIALEQPTAAASFRSLGQKLAMCASTVPEHILLTGVCVASFLPGGRLPVPPPLVCGRGGRARRALQWIGLAQPVDSRDSRMARLWSWMGIDSVAAVGIIGGGFLFGIVHIGAKPVEFVTSFPGGAALCYVTYRSRSIWPGWMTHVTMMAYIQVLMLLMGRG